MKAVLFTNGKDVTANKRLQRAIRSKVPQKHLEIIRTMEDFSKRLFQLPKEIDVAVLLAQSNKQLESLVSLRDFLDDVRIILILPNRERETVLKGYRLWPRYIGYMDEDFSNVAAVFEKNA